MMIRRRVFSFVFILVGLLAGPVRADWINLTGAETARNIAEITVLDDRVRVVLEAYVGDLETFQDLVPDDWLREAETARPPLDARVAHFSSEVFKVVTGTGETLPAELKLVEPRQRVDRQSPFAGMINPTTRQRVPEPPKDKRVLYAEIEYPFAGRPETLTFIPPLDARGVAQVNIGFIAYHKAVPVVDFRYLGAPATLTLDWDDPWYSKFDNPNLKRHHKSALMSYLYVEPYEVRHEVLTRVRDLEAWMDLGLRDDRYIEPDEWEPLKQRVGEFLLDKNRVRIDGKPVKAILDRSNYVTVSVKGIRIVEKPQRLEVSTAIVGVILAYVIGGMPQEVTVDWELFTDQVQRIPATATDPAGPLITYLEPGDNVHRWQNFLKNYVPPTVADIRVDPSLTALQVPVSSLVLVLLAAVLGWMGYRRYQRGNGALVLAVAPPVVLLALALATLPFARVAVPNPFAGAPVPPPERAKAVLEGVFTNIYRAFDFRDEEAVYDKLAVSVAGEKLTEIYLQNRQALVLKNQGGARARVQEVTVLAVDGLEGLDDSQGFRVRADWTVQGRVGHWGHVHQRRNRYQAILTLVAKDGVWKLIDLELLEETREL